VSIGVGPLEYSWTFGDGNVSSGAYVNHTYGSPESYRVGLTATDALGDRATAGATVLVAARPTASIAVNGTAGIGDPLAFSSQVDGGVGPFTYIWLFGDGGGSGSPNASHTFVSAGNYTVEFWANDSLGSSAHATLVVQVPAPVHGRGTGVPTGGAGNSPAESWEWIALAAVGAAVAVAVALVVLARRRLPKRP